MSLNHLHREYEELVGPIFVIPRGRLVGAELQIRPFALATNAPKDDTLQLVLEVRTRPDGEFEAVANSPVLSQYTDAVVEVVAPLREAPPTDENGHTPWLASGSDPEPVGRFRLIHAGKQEPRYALRLIGI